MRTRYRQPSAGRGSAFELDSSSEATLNGSGNDVGILGSNVTVYGSGEVFTQGAGGLTCIIIEGSDDTDDLSGVDYIDEGAGGGYEGGDYSRPLENFARHGVPPARLLFRHEENLEERWRNCFFMKNKTIGSRRATV